jgi:TPP-dependent pyruvate/acetoin dehydrogenase alpha subunit
MYGEHLTSVGILTDAAVDEMEAEFQREIREAFEYALASPHPTESDLYNHVYAE